MPKRSKQSSGRKGVLVVMIVTLMGAGGLAAYVRYAPLAAHVPIVAKSTAPDVTISAEPETKSDAGSRNSVSSELLVPGVVNNEVKLVRPIGDIPSDTKPEVYVVNQTLSSLMIDKARAIGVDMKGKVAMMDFNPAIVKGYGSIEEGNLIKALQIALGQFPNIDKFQIVVEGSPIDSLGEISLDGPIDVIRPGQAPKTSEESKPPNPN